MSRIWIQFKLPKKLINKQRRCQDFLNGFQKRKKTKKKHKINILLVRFELWQSRFANQAFYSGATTVYLSVNLIWHAMHLNCIQIFLQYLNFNSLNPLISTKFHVLSWNFDMFSNFLSNTIHKSICSQLRSKLQLQTLSKSTAQLLLSILRQSTSAFISKTFLSSTKEIVPVAVPQATIFIFPNTRLGRARKAEKKRRKWSLEMEIKCKNNS